MRCLICNLSSMLLLQASMWRHFCRQSHGIKLRPGPSQFGLSFSINLCLRSQPLPPSLERMKPVEGPSSVSEQVSRSPVQSAKNINMDASPTARESRQSLKDKSNHPFVEHMWLSSFHRTGVFHFELLFTVSDIHHVRRGLEATNCWQTSVGELLRAIPGFDRCKQDRLKNSR